MVSFEQGYCHCFRSREFKYRWCLYVQVSLETVRKVIGGEQGRAHQQVAHIHIANIIPQDRRADFKMAESPTVTLLTLEFTIFQHSFAKYLVHEKHTLRIVRAHNCASKGFSRKAADVVGMSMSEEIKRGASLHGLIIWRAKGVDADREGGYKTMVRNTWGHYKVGRGYELNGS